MGSKKYFLFILINSIDVDLFFTTVSKKKAKCITITFFERLQHYYKASQHFFNLQNVNQNGGTSSFKN